MAAIILIHVKLSSLIALFNVIFRKPFKASICRVNAMIFSLAVLPAILLGIIIFITGSSTYVLADTLNPQLYSIDESPFGTPYSTWIAKWMNWTAGLSKIDHPRDFAERTCNVGQTSKDVWFLPDTLNGNIVRECELPYGKAIFIPITIGWQAQAENAELQGKPLSEIENQLISNAFYCDNYNIVRAAEIDGKRIQGLDGDSPYRTNTTKIFNLTYGDNNNYDIIPQTTPTFAEGWFLFIKPLPVGDHTLKIDSKIANPSADFCDYTGHAEWTIKIK